MWNAWNLNKLCTMLICSHVMCINFKLYYASYRLTKTRNWIKHRSLSLVSLYESCHLLFSLIIDVASQFYPNRFVSNGFIATASACSHVHTHTHTNTPTLYAHFPRGVYNMQNGYRCEETRYAFRNAEWEGNFPGILKVFFLTKIANVIMLLSANYCRLLPHLRFVSLLFTQIYIRWSYEN